ncbi:CTD kinase-I gamma subunit [Scheffersomyces coipomensis]|uniref:CTD kinase-I gamma subunit n=1 Tax=Scheffersomyces coipomensis TaxID=1788519 RepID=UPI00315D8809
MDSFEAATQFSQILRNLTPSLQTLTKAAHFALKNSESEDYLFPTIIEVISDNSIELNTKSNLFQFIEVLINESFYFSKQSKYNHPYVQNLKQSLPSIILQVLPNVNNSNIYNVYKSLIKISKQFKINSKEYIHQFNVSLLNDDDLKNIDDNIPFPQIGISEINKSLDPLLSAWDILIQKKRQSEYERLRLLNHTEFESEDVAEDLMFSIKEKSDKSTTLLSKKQILWRMEEDRESHKRSKEGLWMVNRSKEDNSVGEEEFLNMYWNKYDVLNHEEDKALLDSLGELNKIVAASYKDSQF